MKSKSTINENPYISMGASEFLSIKKNNPDYIDRITKKLLICIKTNE